MCKVVIREAINPNLKVLNVLGFYMPENVSPFLRFLYKLYGLLFVGFTFITQMITEFINVVLSVKDLEKLTDASFLFLTHFAQVSKVLYFTTNNRKIQELADSFQKNVFQPRNESQSKMIKKSIYLSNAIFYIFFAMVVATCLLWAIFPFLDTELHLPLVVYYPFSTDSTPIFQIIFCYQIFATTVNGITNISKDTTVTGLMSIICGELDMLNDTLVNIKEYASENIKFKKMYLNENKRLDSKLQKEMDKILISCVEHHKSILDTADVVSKLFSISTFVQFVIGTIIICITMFRLTMVQLFSIQFISMVLYQACIVFEILLYCYFGNEIIIKSSQLSTSAYCSDWTNCSIPFQKNLLFFMTRTKYPLKITAANFFSLSLETFVAIMKSSWSYFAVLNRVHQN